MKRSADQLEDNANNGLRSKRVTVEKDVQSLFRDGLFDEKTRSRYEKLYEVSVPYRHAVIHDLVDPSLLKDVRSEIQTNISFSPKETDIYKIYQSGDLANLDGLDESALKVLPSLVKLRDALYSREFRSYLASITGSGPLSGQKTDMAVNVYTPGCHLLCHDDVIGTRRVSYILYLTDPEREWKPEWGGALRLYPTRTWTGADGKEIKTPEHTHSVSIPPAFNQLSFFAVQPGESFHDVEEVYARTGESDDTKDDGGRVRMAISGWYHIPQEGEEGYEPGVEAAQAERSSLSQLQAKVDGSEVPQPEWISVDDDESIEEDDEESELTEEQLTFLIKFINPRYLVPDTVAELEEAFEEESALQLADFLSNKFSNSLRTELEQTQTQGPSLLEHWQTAQPPHKQRYQFLSPRKNHTTNGKSAQIHSSSLQDLTERLFPSLAFRKWLSLVTGLSLKACNVLARRFRRGIDYTLAKSYEDSQPQLELCLCITPSTGWEEEDRARENGNENGNSSNSKSDQDKNKPESGAGGYLMYMAGDEVDEDGAEDDEDGDAPGPSGLRGHAQEQSSYTGAGSRRSTSKKADPAVYKEGNDEDDDGILFTAPASWNTLSLVLRDAGVLRFVKYVSASAPGDRWDVLGEWKVEDDDT